MQIYNLPGGHSAPPEPSLGGAQGPHLPLHRAGRVNQSCLTADIWFPSECGNTIPVSEVIHDTKSTNQLRYAQDGLCDPQGGSSRAPEIQSGSGLY